jgi:hypothetical protein
MPRKEFLRRLSRAPSSVDPNNPSFPNRELPPKTPLTGIPQVQESVMDVEGIRFVRPSVRNRTPDGPTLNGRPEVVAKEISSMIPRSSEPDRGQGEQAR